MKCLARVRADENDAATALQLPEKLLLVSGSERVHSCCGQVGSASEWLVACLKSKGRQSPFKASVGWKGEDWEIGVAGPALPNHWTSAHPARSWVPASKLKG